MGVVTISVSKEIEEKLRRLAAARFSRRKGYLSKAITEALQEWANKENNLAVTEGLELLKKGKNMGGMVSKKRGDWHKR